MPNHLNDILYDTAEEVFENLAFVLTMPEGEGLDDFDLGSFEPASLDEEEEHLEEEQSEEHLVEEHFVSEDFVDTESEEDSMPHADEETIVASIHFRGPFDGELFLEVSTELLPIIGMNMLGLDDENALTPDEQKDAFKELLNVICGNLLPAIAGVKAVFNINSAELRDDSVPETYNGEAPLGIAHFGLEVGHAKLAFFADERIHQNNEVDAQSCA